MTQTSELSRKQQKLIAALLEANTLTEAARAAGMSDDTARRYLAEPHVKAAYDAASKRMFDEALQGLQNSISLARQTLTRNLGEEAPPAQQVAAAKILLDKALEVSAIAALEQRLTELEKKLSER